MTATEIEFGGHLPVFESLANVGTHPLMKIFEHPPPGYRFVQTSVSEPSDTMVARTEQAVRKLGEELPRAHKSVTIDAVNRFLKSRHMASQLLQPEACNLIVFPTFPMTLGHVPWMLEIEETTPLFHPFFGNGQTEDLDLDRHPGYWMVRHMILSDECRGIVTHMRCTAETLPILFRDEALAKKVFYARLALPPSDIPAAIPDRDPDTVTFLFTNSWHQEDSGFFVRGGNDILAAFLTLLDKHPNLRLIIRSQLPARLGAKVIQRVRAHPAITVYDEPLTPEDMDAVMAKADAHLIVSAHAHVITALRAMAYGQALVVSDGWAIDEYSKHGENAIVVPGRAGRCWRYDADAGFVRENWRPLSQIDPDFVKRLIATVEALIAEPRAIEALGRRGRQAIEARYTLAGWNEGLRTALDAATA